MRPITDEELFLAISRSIDELAQAVEEAKSDDHGLTITARVSRGYCTPEEKAEVKKK